MSLIRKLAIGAVLAASALVASNASAKPLPLPQHGLQKHHIKLCIPHTFTRVVRVGFHRYLITYHVNRFCRLTVVRVIRLPHFPYRPHHS